MVSGGSPVQITQPPNGSFCGTPSSVTSARLAPEPAMPRSDTPCVVGLAPRLEVRRKSEKPGTEASASSSRSLIFSTGGSTATIEKAGSPAAGGSCAVTTTCAAAGA